MLHPLHTIEWLTDSIKGTGTYPDPTRRTGRSTAQALRLLAKAIETPHVKVYIKDHHGSEPAHRNLRYMMQGMAEKLGLEHMQFTQDTVTFTRK